MKYLSLVLGLLVLSPFSYANELEAGVTNQGLHYFVGGVGVDERAVMERQFGHYPLRVEVAEKSGAYIVDVGVSLFDEQGELLLEVQMEGPVLLVDLQPGTYQLKASYGMQSQSRKLTVSAGKQTKTTFLWDAGGS